MKYQPQLRVVHVDDGLSRLAALRESLTPAPEPDSLAPTLPSSVPLPAVPAVDSQPPLGFTPCDNRRGVIQMRHKLNGGRCALCGYEQGALRV